MIDISDIRENMTVLDARGNHVGTVACLVDASEIKLSRRDTVDGLHHYIPIDWVGTVDGSVHLKTTTADVLRGRY